MDNFRDRIKVVEDKPVERLSDREARRMYEKFVLRQEEQFLLFINFLNKYINELRDKGEVSPFLEFRARIKATNSALKNYEQKALDDIFGIEFICAAHTEIEVIKSELEKLLNIHKEKAHDKENGYKAIHHSCSMKKELIEKLNQISKEKTGEIKNNEDFPAIEIQYKTIEVFYQSTFGTASHEKYKGVKLPQLQALYDSDSLTIGEYIPYMWISDPRNDDMRELAKEEILKKMYPSLKLRRETEEKEQQVEDDKGNER